MILPFQRHCAVSGDIGVTLGELLARRGRVRGTAQPPQHPPENEPARCQQCRPGETPFCFPVLPCPQPTTEGTLPLPMVCLTLCAPEPRV